MIHDPTFRFAAVRPAQRASSGQDAMTGIRYALDGSVSPLHAQVRAMPKDSAAKSARQLAVSFLNAWSPKSAPIDEALAAKASTLASVAEVSTLVNDTLGATLASISTSPQVKQVWGDLWDYVYASVIAPNDSRGWVTALQEIRLIELAFRWGKQKPVEIPVAWGIVRGLRPIIPRDLVFEPELPADVNAASSKEFGTTLETSVKKVQTLSDAALDLAAARIAHPVPMAAPTVTAAPQVSDDTVAREKVEWKTQDWLETQTNHLRDSTKAVLTDMKDALRGLDVDHVIEAIRGEAAQQVGRLIADASASQLRAASGGEASEKLAQLLNLAPPAFLPFSVPATATPKAGSSGKARGIRPLGVADLLVVQQRLTHYSLGEVAHVENVLASERRLRTHSRETEIEEVVTEETERATESERDLQSTERHELHEEAQQVIQESQKFTAGVSVTASYGFVTVNAHADTDTSTSISDSHARSADFAKSVTERSVSRVKERVRIERTRRKLDRTKEINEHGFDNSTGGTHKVGVYRWIDKHYRARLVNFGRRMMFEFIVPEPAELYIYAKTKALDSLASNPGVKRPPEPTIGGRTLRPSDLQQWNYEAFVATYMVAGVLPPPAPSLTLSAHTGKVAEGTPTNNVPFLSQSVLLTVPEGYAVSGYETVFAGAHFGNKGWSQAFIAGAEYGKGDWLSVTKEVTVTIHGWCVSAFVSAKVLCRRTDAALAKWQVDTYKSIMDAYSAALLAYQQALAERQIQQGVPIRGQNPGINRKVIDAELKRGALRLLTNGYARIGVGGGWRVNERFDAAGHVGAGGMPAFDIAEASVEGKIIQFFEQAFEWGNATHAMYPYQWAREQTWESRLVMDDTDPDFNDFLRAGAARVVVPVRPGYEETILHYLATDEIWPGGEPPVIGDPLYVSIIADVRAAIAADPDNELPSSDSGTYPCVVDSWNVAVPTSLVYLQADATLPEGRAEQQGAIKIRSLKSSINPRRVTLDLSGPLPKGTWTLFVGDSAAGSLHSVGGQSLIDVPLRDEVPLPVPQDLGRISLIDRSTGAWIGALVA